MENKNETRTGTDNNKKHNEKINTPATPNSNTDSDKQRDDDRILEDSKAADTQRSNQRDIEEAAIEQEKQLNATVDGRTATRLYNKAIQVFDPDSVEIQLAEHWHYTDKEHTEDGYI